MVRVQPAGTLGQSSRTIKQVVIRLVRLLARRLVGLIERRMLVTQNDMPIEREVVMGFTLFPGETLGTRGRGVGECHLDRGRGPLLQLGQDKVDLMRVGTRRLRQQRNTRHLRRQRLPALILHRRAANARRRAKLVRRQTHRHVLAVVVAGIKPERERFRLGPRHCREAKHQRGREQGSFHRSLGPGARGIEHPTAAKTRLGLSVGIDSLTNTLQGPAFRKPDARGLQSPACWGETDEQRA